MAITDFGGKLRQARERRGLSLRQVSASTKISVAALEALERNDLSKLPGGIFSRAFVRSYASEVGLEPDETVREFLERFGAAGGPPAPAAPPPPPRRAQPSSASKDPAAREAPIRQVELGDDESTFGSRQRMAAALVKLLLIGLPLAGIILYLTLGRGPAAPSPTDAADEGLPEATSSSTIDTPEGVEPAARPPMSTAAAPVPGVAAEQPLVLEIHPTAPCRVTVTVDGERVLSRLMQPGEKEVRRIREAAVVEVDDAGAFAFSIDGRPGRPLGATGEARTARISRANLAQYLR